MEGKEEGEEEEDGGRKEEEGMKGRVKREERPWWILKGEKESVMRYGKERGEGQGTKGRGREDDG